MKKIILITGATGLIGSRLARILYELDYDIHIISRDTDKSKASLPFVDKVISIRDLFSDKANSLLFNSEEIQYTAVINLAGASIAGKRWTAEYKKIILESRTKITSRLSELINNTDYPPKQYISTSAIGYYGDTGDNITFENSKSGNDFLANVCSQWEAEALKASEHTKVAIARLGMVLSKDGGALPKMILPYKFFVGGPIGSKKQWISWIHIDDVISLFIFLLDNNHEGIFNFVSTEPLTMKEFSKAIGNAIHRPSFFPIPKIAMKLLLGEASSIVLNSQKISSIKIRGFGYNLKFDDINTALNDLV